MYAIIRCQKIKNWSSVSNLYRHHMRLSQVENADSSRPIEVLKSCSHDNLNQTVRAKIGEQTIRKDAVLAQEVFCGASPEYFRPDNPDEYGAYDGIKMQAWAKSAFDYLVETYGCNLVFAVLHLDEATPHIHGIVVPLDDRGKLNAAKVFNRQHCREMQTNYAAALAPLGLKRGKEGSTRRHQPMREWYAERKKAKLPSSTTEHQKRTEVNIFQNHHREIANG